MSCTNHRQILVSVLALSLIATAANPAFAGDRDGRKAVQEETRFEKVDSTVKPGGGVPTVALILELEVPYSIDEMLDERTQGVAEQRIAEAQRALLADLARGGSLVRSQTYAVVPMVAVTVDARKVADLERHPLVRTVFEDKVLAAQLANSVPLINAPSVWINAGVNGSGQTIAILDTGVDATHPSLAGKIVSEACFSVTDPIANEVSLCPGGVPTSIATGSGSNCVGLLNCDHGTHVAGIAAGNGPNVLGVAPGANVIAMQVFFRQNGPSAGSPHQDCTNNNAPTPCVLTKDSAIIAGLTRVFQLLPQFDIAAVNMSLGGDFFPGTCNGEPVAAPISLLRAAGVAVVSASGNNGFINGMNSPACVGAAISVGRTDNQDNVNASSNSGPELDLLAPGVGITSATIGGGTRTMGGTSQAAPHVSGAMALLRDMNPSISVDDMESVLKASGVPVTDPRNGLVVPRLRFVLSEDNEVTPWDIANASNTLLDRLAVLVADDRYELSGEYFQEYLEELIQQIEIMIDCHEIMPGAGC